MIGEIFHDGYGYLMVLSYDSTNRFFSYVVIPFNRIQIHHLSTFYLENLTKLT